MRDRDRHKERETEREKERNEGGSEGTRETVRLCSSPLTSQGIMQNAGIEMPSDEGRMGISKLYVLEKTQWQLSSDFEIL